MNVILRDGNVSVVSLAPGEEFVGALRDFAEVEGIAAATLTAIGAAREVELAWYDVDVQEYSMRTLEEKLEIASVVGNIGVSEEGIVVHAHGVLSDREMASYAGHINRMVIAAACEVTVWRLDGEIRRAFDEGTGLKLMQS